MGLLGAGLPTSLQVRRLKRRQAGRLAPGPWSAHVRYPVMLGEVAAQAAGSPWELSPSSVRWDDRSQLQAGGFKGQ